MSVEPSASYRLRLLETILPLLRADARVRGCWEGGSAATGRADAYSDIDLCLLVDAAAHRDVLDDFERGLRSATPIASVWHVEPPAFAGVTQRVYRLDDAPRFFLLDCAVLTDDAAAQFLERERHGEPVVYFDRSAAIVARPLDVERHRERIRQRLRHIRASWPVYLALVEKELARGRRLDAIGFYFGGVLRLLLELAGMRHRPERFDYGWRYLHDDLPVGLQSQFESFAYVASPAQVAGNLAALNRLASGLIEELSARYEDSAAPDRAP